MMTIASLDYEYILSDLQIIVKLNPTSKGFRVYYINKYFSCLDQSFGYDIWMKALYQRVVQRVTGNHFPRQISPVQRTI